MAPLPNSVRNVETGVALASFVVVEPISKGNTIDFDLVDGFGRVRAAAGP